MPDPLDGWSEAPEPDPQRPPPNTPDPSEAKTAADRLVAIALHHYRIGRSERDEPFAVRLNGPNLAHPLRGSGSLRAELAREHHRRTGKVPATSALADALGVLEGYALQAERESVALRVARDDLGVTIDLGDETGRAVVVKPDGWEVLGRSPRLFRRTKLTSPLPVPERGGSLEELRELLNVAEEGWPLLVAWMVAGLLADIPHPILLLTGHHGSGKSNAAKMIRGLIDPSPAPLSATPKDQETWIVSAYASWCVAIDNVSSVPEWWADALCRSTGGDGLIRRQLYADEEVSVIHLLRLVMLNGIDLSALRGDMGSRLLYVDLERIGPHQRRTERELWRAYQERAPRMLGGLLDLFSAVLRELPTIELEGAPRMADFAPVVAAVDRILGTHALADYLGQEGRVADDVIDSAPVAQAVVGLMQEMGPAAWEGTASQLLDKLTQGLGESKPPRAWPGSPKGLSDQLRRFEESLGHRGIRIEFTRETSRERRRIIRLSRATPGEREPAAPEPPAGDRERGEL